LRVPRLPGRGERRNTHVRGHRGWTHPPVRPRGLPLDGGPRRHGRLRNGIGDERRLRTAGGTTAAVAVRLSTGLSGGHSASGTLTGMVEPSRLAAAVGLYSVRELETRGVDRRGREQLVRRGRILPVARGWFATPEADESAVGALRAGVRLTCVSAGRVHGLWTPVVPGTHAYGRRGPTPPGYVPHGPFFDAWPEREPVASLPLCLEHAARCLPDELAATMFESALTQQLLHPAEVEGLTRQIPVHCREKLLPLSGRSESGSETRVARWLRARCVPFTQQVQLSGVGRVDFLVGRCWVIEVDSIAHHTSV